MMSLSGLAAKLYFETYSCSSGLVQVDAADAATNRGCFEFMKAFASLCLKETFVTSSLISILHPIILKMSMPRRTSLDNDSTTWKTALTCFTSITFEFGLMMSKISVTAPSVSLIFEWQSCTEILWF